METIAIIPARGGSKGIPRKNIVDLAGKPLLAYSIEAIKKSKAVRKIIVSTDDAEIAEIAKKYGAEVPFMRPAELAQDDTPARAVIDHAIKWVLENTFIRPEYILLAEATSPFIKSQQIDFLLDLMISKKADSGITMIPVPRMYHPYHIRKIGEDGFLELNDKEMHYTHPTRQSDPPRYAHGNMWWFRTDMFLKERKIEAGKAVGLEIDEISAWDINDKMNLEIARYFQAHGIN
jgi:CMP-N,N'-diacetyllegionaminic acid synthase